MKPGKYTLRELFTDRSIQQIIIPEIQRDYVWGQTQVESLLEAIKDAYTEFSAGKKIETSYYDKEVQETFELFIKRQKYSCNIGFIYAYSDPDCPGKYFLIDGQQRLTTIYLLLLVLSRKLVYFKESFERLYTFSGNPFIDYRVRDISKKFVRDLVVHYEDASSIKNQMWYYKEYDNDKTISSIVKNIACIEQFLVNEDLCNDSFCQYLQDYIEFWYFDTSVSTQGEELYIYMNARGEQTQENENLKADLLEQLPAAENLYKAEWGKKWEQWQDFFWRRRGANLNADAGFNEFINCIAGAENFFKSKNIVYKSNEFTTRLEQNKNGIDYSDIKVCFANNGLEVVKEYFEDLNFLFNDSNVSEFKSIYQNSYWIDSCQFEIFDLLNTNNTNWFADISDSNRGTELSRMVFIWSIFYFMKSARRTALPVEQIFEVIRLFYTRFKNYNRSIKNIQEYIDDILLNGIYAEHGSHDTEDEKIKHDFLRSKTDPHDLVAFEEAIWVIEDHPLNINGRDLQAINSTHLIDYAQKPDLQILYKIKEKFFALFPVEQDGKSRKDNDSLIATLLLFYGYSGERIGPWYCYNYDFGNFGKIIRSIGGSGQPFRLFFNDYLNFDLNNIYSMKVNCENPNFSTTSFHEALQWYAVKLGEKMWSQGLYIVYEHDKFPENDEYYPNIQQLVNTKGDVRGYSAQVLAKLLDGD